jgi:uncharacterized protein YecE (DUF72 family)
MGLPRIRVGVGGWVYEPWRDNFYPAGWPHSRELEYASRHLSAIEINGTYYSTPSRASVAKWRDATPEDFVFSLKASRFATNRRVLAEAGESVSRFIGSGIAELGPKLGPIVWQFASTKRFDPADFEAFLKLLPPSVEGLRLRHVMDVRHDSFKTPEYLALARRYGVGTVLTESDEYPALFDPQNGLVYARIMRTDSALPEGCTPQTLDALAACAQLLQSGGLPAGMPMADATPAAPAAPSPPATARDVFVFFISGAKERAPAAAMALLRRLGGPAPA